MSIRTELEKDRSSGKSRGVPRPWNTFDLTNRYLKDIELKAKDVELGTERFDRDEIQQALAYLIKR